MNEQVQFNKHLRQELAAKEAKLTKEREGVASSREIQKRWSTKYTQQVKTLKEEKKTWQGEQEGLQAVLRETKAQLVLQNKELEELGAQSVVPLSSSCDLPGAAEYSTWKRRLRTRSQKLPNWVTTRRGSTN